MINKPRIAFVFLLVLVISPALEYVEAQSRKISGDQYFGCTDRDHFEKLVKYVLQKDMEAFKKGLTAGISNGSCTVFKQGEEIFRDDTTASSSAGILVKVRRKSEVVEYWTPIKATYSYDDERRSPSGAPCCRICSDGQACGDTCIARGLTCNVGPGCACNE